MRLVTLILGSFPDLIIDESAGVGGSANLNARKSFK